MQIDVRSHALEFVNMHETVLKDMLSHRSRTFGHAVHKQKLGLHIGRKPRVRSGTDRNRTWALMHCQTDPCFRHRDLCSGITQSRRHRVQMGWIDIMKMHLSLRDRTRHQEGAGLDTVRNYPV